MFISSFSFPYVHATTSSAYIALSLISVSLFVFALGLIVSCLRSGNADPKVLLAGFVLLFVAIITLLVGIVLVSKFEGSLSNVFNIFLALFS